jgi:CubicO group peptidase (beta-lactamase class C family)
MDDEFLYRIQETPPRDFVDALKVRLNRKRTSASSRTQKLIIALLSGGVAFATTIVSMRGGIDGVPEQPVSAAASSRTPNPLGIQTESITPEAQATTRPENQLSESVARVEEQPSADWKGDRGTLLQVMQKYGVPGVIVAVIKDFEVHWTKGYGLADVASDQAVEANTLFQAGGLSQLGAAIATLKLSEIGLVSLDGDVNESLKSWKAPQSALTEERPVTLRTLLSHTSGADERLRPPGYDPAEALPTLAQIIEGEPPANTPAVHFALPPFTSYDYTGGGPVIAQLLIVDTLGEPFATTMQRYLLDPLGMNNSTYEQPIPRALEIRTASGHDRRGIAMRPRWFVHPEQATAGLWSTAADLAQIAIEIQRALNGSSGRVLSRESAHELVTPVGIGPFALSFIPRADGMFVWHGGRNRGFYSALFAHRSGYGLIVMTNGDNGRKVADELLARVAAAYAWDRLDLTDDATEAQ